MLFNRHQEKQNKMADGDVVLNLFLKKQYHKERFQKSAFLYLF